MLGSSCIQTLFSFRDCQEKDNRIMVAEQLWILEFWLRTSRRVDTTMEQVVANLQQKLSSQQPAIQQLLTMLED